MVKKLQPIIILGMFLIGVAVGGLIPAEAEARGIYVPVNQNVYGPGVFGPAPVYRVYPEPGRRHRPQTIGAPLVGSNDAMYERDNIYGPGASAAGRMSHVTKNVFPPGHIYY